MARMTTRRAVLLGILAGILVGIGIAALAWIVADRNRQPGQPPAAATTTISPGATQPTIPPPPTVTALAATSSTVMATGKTTRDPNTFTTGTVAGPIQVRVLGESSCQGLGRPGLAGPLPGHQRRPPPHRAGARPGRPPTPRPAQAHPDPGPRGAS